MAATKNIALDAGNITGAQPRPELNSIQERQLAESLKNQFRMQMRAAELVPVTLAPSYRHPFGQVMPVRLNGMSIYIPCDGKTYRIPKPFAAIVHARRRAFDEQELRQERMAQVSDNYEQFPGQRQFG